MEGTDNAERHGGVGCELWSISREESILCDSDNSHYSFKKRLR